MTNVLTLRLDEGSQMFFESQRQKYFPAARNQVPAHLSLFHTLPDEASISDTLAAVAGRQTSFPLAVTGLRSLGRGVAYKVASAELLSLAGELAASFADHLSAQDKQRFSPHIVIQNKATPEAARALLAELERSFHALEAQAIGLDLWHYLGGPWQLAETFSFGA